MLATLREYMGTTERDRRVLDLQQQPKPITLGRSDTCTYKIGQTLGSLSLGISKVQATIIFDADRITLKDGGAEGVSTNGIYCHTEKVDGEIVLTPGLELTLFKHGLAKVSLVVADLAVVEYGKDTYTGQDLLSVLQEQVGVMGSQMDALQLQVGLLGTQLEQRQAIDRSQEQRDHIQEERLLATEKRLNRVVSLLLAAIAIIVLAFGWSGGNSEDKKQWSSTFTSMAIGIAALYLKSKENTVTPAKT